MCFPTNSLPVQTFGSFVALSRAFLDNSFSLRCLLVEDINYRGGRKKCMIMDTTWTIFSKYFLASFKTLVLGSFFPSCFNCTVCGIFGLTFNGNLSPISCGRKQKRRQSKAKTTRKNETYNESNSSRRKWLNGKVVFLFLLYSFFLCRNQFEIVL